MKSRFERGAVVRCRDQLWIIWTYPRARGADPVALPLVYQTGLRHRSHVRVSGGLAGMRPEAVLLIHTCDPQSIPGSDCEQINQCSPALITQIDLTMRRAVEAQQQEQPAHVETA